VAGELRFRGHRHVRCRPARRSCVCTHRACVRTALINEISKVMAPEVDLEVLPWSRVERSGRAFGATGAAHGPGRCDPEPSFGRSSCLPARIFGVPVLRPLPALRGHPPTRIGDVEGAR